MKNRKAKKGFTIIELVIVIAVIHRYFGRRSDSYIQQCNC